MTLLKFDDEFYLLDKENKPTKGQKFLILYEDESYGEVAENTIDDFSDYADEEWTDECHTVLASTKEIKGLPSLDIKNINSIIDGGEEWDVEIETKSKINNYITIIKLK